MTPTENKMTRSGAKCCHFSVSALGPSQPNSNPPDTERRGAPPPPTRPLKCHICEYKCSLSFLHEPLHPFDTQKDNWRIEKKTYLKTWTLQRLPSMLWVSVCVLCDGVWKSWQVWQGLDILLMEMMPSPSHQCHTVSLGVHHRLCRNKNNPKGGGGKKNMS